MDDLKDLNEIEILKAEAVFKEDLDRELLKRAKAFYAFVINPVKFLKWITTRPIECQKRTFKLVIKILEREQEYEKCNLLCYLREKI